MGGGGRSGSLFIRYCLDDGRFCMLMTFNQFLFDKKTILFYSDINLKLKWNMPTLIIRALGGGGGGEGGGNQVLYL